MTNKESISELTGKVSFRAICSYQLNHLNGYFYVMKKNKTVINFAFYMDMFALIRINTY